MREGDGFLAKIMPATRILQAMTSNGKVEQGLVDKAEKVIKKGKDDYADYFDEIFKRHVREMEDYTSRIDAEKNAKNLINLMAASIANFRADSSMLGQSKYLGLCSICLGWIESIKKLDPDVQDILDVYLVTIKKMKAIENLSAGHEDSFTLEIDKACQRYFDKHQEISAEISIDNSCTLYVSERNHDCGIKEEILEEEGL